MADHDSGYKLLFSHPRMVEELLRDFVREDWISSLDFRTLKKVGGSFVSDDLRERHSDTIWRLRSKGPGHAGSMSTCSWSSNRPPTRSWPCA